MVKTELKIRGNHSKNIEETIESKERTIETQRETIRRTGNTIEKQRGDNGRK